MIKITITSVKVDSDFVKQHAGYVVGDTAYYVIRESGKRLSVFFQYETDALQCAWSMVKHFGLTLVEPW